MDTYGKQTFHRNLNGKDGAMWSIVMNHGGGKKSHPQRKLYAEGVTIKQPSGVKFERCLAGAKRAVFAWFKTGMTCTDDLAPALPENAQRVRFNPKAGDTYFHIDGVRVDSLSQVWCLENGECWAVR